MHNYNSLDGWWERRNVRPHLLGLKIAPQIEPLNEAPAPRFNGATPRFSCVWNSRTQWGEEGRGALPQVRPSALEGVALAPGITRKRIVGVYLLGRTTSSATIDGLWFAHTIGKVPVLSAVNSTFMTCPRLSSSALS